MGLLDQDYVDDRQEEEVSETDTDAQLQEVESCLQEAGYYRTLMDAPLFDDPDDEIGQRVQKKVKDFARREIGVIIRGRTQEQEHPAMKALASLAEEEVSVLKLFLTGLPEQEVLALRAILQRLVSDPSTVKVFLQAATSVRPSPASAHPVPGPKRPTIRPIKMAPRSAPSISRGKPPERKSQTAPRREPQVTRQPSPPPEEEPPHERGRLRPAKLKSPTSREMPIGKEFAIASQINAEKAADVGFDNADEGLRRRVEMPDQHPGEGLNPRSFGGST